MLLKTVSKFRSKTNRDVLRGLVACNFTKSNTPPWVLSLFLNCTNSNKSRNASRLLELNLLVFENYIKN